MVVQPAILTYPTMVFYFLLGPQVLWNDLHVRVIVITLRIRNDFDQKDKSNLMAIETNVFNGGEGNEVMMNHQWIACVIIMNCISSTLNWRIGQ